MSIPLNIISLQFKELESGFVRWLKTLNYSEETIKARKRSIREFLLYMERCDIDNVESMSDEKVKRFVRYLGRRKNRKFGSGLMNASINVSIACVNKFFEYLQQIEKPAPDNLQYLETNYKPINILTMKEINQLYEATYQKHHFSKAEVKARQQAVWQRDRAMLSIYYGCGLRKSEGVNLNTEDILIERKLIYVRKGKGSKERHVPVTENNLKYITEYLQESRNFLLAENETDSFFINQYGESCSAAALSLRLTRLAKNSGSSVLRAKKPTLHTLRHSIATHLLQQGMEIEMIQKFLGHSSLETTQIYTHILND
ncbi:MAG: tyrosine-type recombinase/integrase [Bacteroidales bacterium]|jgi:integrase/recombinase XerD|nr:tyrosine-type recombinase/integrase [Bacteroidales bacterium]